MSKRFHIGDVINYYTGKVLLLARPNCFQKARVSSDSNVDLVGYIIGNAYSPEQNAFVVKAVRSHLEQLFPFLKEIDKLPIPDSQAVLSTRDVPQLTDEFSAENARFLKRLEKIIKTAWEEQSPERQARLEAFLGDPELTISTKLTVYFHMVISHPKANNRYQALDEHAFEVANQIHGRKLNFRDAADYKILHTTAKITTILGHKLATFIERKWEAPRAEWFQHLAEKYECGEWLEVTPLKHKIRLGSLEQTIRLEHPNVIIKGATPDASKKIHFITFRFGLTGEDTAVLPLYTPHTDLAQALIAIGNASLGSNRAGIAISMHDFRASDPEDKRFLKIGFDNAEDAAATCRFYLAEFSRLGIKNPERIINEVAVAEGDHHNVEFDIEALNNIRIIGQTAKELLFNNLEIALGIPVTRQAARA